MSLLFNMQSRFVIKFSSKEQATFNFMVAVTVCSNFGAQRYKICHYFWFFHFYLPLNDGTGCMILVFWMLNFKSTFSLSSFTLIKRLSSSSLLSPIRVISSVYLRLLIHLLEILIPAFASSSLAFYMMYSAYKLISRVTTYILDILLSQFGTCPLFHVPF